MSVFCERHLYWLKHSIPVNHPCFVCILPAISLGLSAPDDDTDDEAEASLVGYVTVFVTGLSRRILSDVSRGICLRDWYLNAPGKQMKFKFLSPLLIFTVLVKAKIFFFFTEISAFHLNWDEVDVGKTLVSDALYIL